MGCHSWQKNPFVSHAFLTALETGGAIGGNSGWSAMHLLLRSENGQLLGAMPHYLKHHSYGEYIFDHSWANAFERAMAVPIIQNCLEPFRLHQPVAQGC